MPRKAPPPQSPDDLLDRDAVAVVVGVTAPTISQYKARGEFPEPDLTFGRAPVWRRATIEAWIATRPGQGTGGGRPRKE